MDDSRYPITTIPASWTFFSVPVNSSGAYEVSAARAASTIKLTSKQKMNFPAVRKGIITVSSFGITPRRQGMGWPAYLLLPARVRLPILQRRLRLLNCQLHWLQNVPYQETDRSP